MDINRQINIKYKALFTIFLSNFFHIIAKRKIIENIIPKKVVAAIKKTKEKKQKIK